MMLRHFKGTGPGVILLIVLLAAGLWLGSFIHPGKAIVFQDRHTAVLYDLLIRGPAIDSLPSVIIAFVMVLLLASLVIVFNTNTFFISERTFLPGLLYIVITALIPDYQYLNPVIPAALFLHLAVVRMAGSYRHSGTAFSFFDAALLIGLGSLFYANLIWYGLLLFIAISILRPPDVREILVSIVGLVSPYIFLYAVFYISDFDLSLLTSGIADSLFARVQEVAWSKMMMIAGIFVLLLLLAAIMHLLSVFTTLKVKSRKVFSLQIWIIILSVLLYFFSPSASGELIFIMAIPASYILTHYFLFRRGRRRISGLLFTLVLLLVITVHLLTALSA